MLSEYKYSVAMGNADEYVKEIANYVTYDHDNDGVHHGIYNILRIFGPIGPNGENALGEGLSLR
ncbi:MAG TPA: HAD hydrolase family protein [Firmicutes bacterium]|jgi:hypothetical protein|nr:HAD hydrolase family protein [Bacillota bacterium]